MKTLLLGWDAADWKVINPMLDEGLLPNLQKLIDNGVMGKLATLDPIYSPMLWTSIATGKRPYKHGVLGFSELAPDGKSVRPTLSVSRKCKAVWNILSQKQYKSHVVGWWPSHPAEQINGFFISDFFQKAQKPLAQGWPVAKDSVHPAERSEEMGKWRVHPNEISFAHLEPFVPDARNIANDTLRKYLVSLQNVTAHCSTLHSVFTRILRSQEWDFAALYLDAIDHYCHGFMKFHPPKRPYIPQNMYDHFKNVVTAGYRFHDMMLGRIMDFVDEETNVIIVSDHGFQPDHLRPSAIPKEPAGPAFEHSPYGIFVMSGPNIKKDELIYGASLLDITPTILKLFNLPVGDDMDGRVLEEVFVEKSPTKRIISWENVEGNAGMPDPDYTLDMKQANHVKQQLAALGYVEGDAIDNNQKAIQKTKDETQFNLARAYLDGGLRDEALPILRSLYEGDKKQLRYGIRLAAVYQSSGEMQLAMKILNEIKDNKLTNDLTINLMKANIYISQQKTEEAIKIYDQLAENIPEGLTRINLQLCKAYIKVERWDQAEHYIKQELELDPDNAVAHQLRGVIMQNTGRFSDAAQSFLDSISLEYETPNNHYNLGLALFNMGDYENAAQSLETALVMNKDLGMARSLLIRIYSIYLKDVEKENGHKKKLEEFSQGRIIVVSGLPRSGTSMMMQMLEAGGLSIFTDKERLADENNPKGYYEHNLVKSLPKNKSWVYKASGKVIKVISPLLQHLPRNFKYKVIHMNRDVKEVLASQEKMLHRLGEEQNDDEQVESLEKQYENILKNIYNWTSSSSNIEILHLQHSEVIEKPFETALLVQEFLQDELVLEKMAMVVDKKLHREKV